MTTRVAECNCGQLKVRVTGEPIRVSVCHCLACQRRSGSVFAMQARFERPNVSIEGTSAAVTNALWSAEASESRPATS
jgi:hypothetical protein